MHDRATKTDVVYNYGLFDFGQEFLHEFAKAQMDYCMAGFPLQDTLDILRQQSHHLVAGLNLTRRTRESA